MSAPSGWLVVGSTAAGSSGEELIESVAGHLARHAPTEAAVTADEEQLADVLRSCGDRVLVVVGGDGSAHLVVNVLARMELLDATTVGFVPLGTANDVATHLGMAAEGREAARQLCGGRVRRLDLLRLDADALDGPELVVNALHAGLGVDGARRARPLKRVLGPVAYPVGVVSSGLVSSGSVVEVRLDGEVVDLGGPALAVAIANGPRLGGVELLAGASVDDGQLDLLAVPARPWWARAASVARVAGRTPSSVELREGRTVELEGDLGEVDADGEMVRTGARCRVEVVPGALRVVTPGPAQPPT